MKTVTFKQFWGRDFIFICFIPLTSLTVLQMLDENWMAAAWQAITLALLCVNNYLHCSNNTLEKELLEQLQINLALIEYVKYNLNKKESEQNK